MRHFFVALTIFLWFLNLTTLVSFGIWSFWWYEKTYEASLRLADDASLPAAKAEHLKEYLVAVSGIKGPPRYIFTRPDLDLAKQRIILAGLIKRFEDIAIMRPVDLAYQQGMYQLTGQEIDHQLARISGIFYSAKLRESIFLYLFFVWGSVLFFIGALMTSIILSAYWHNWKYTNSRQ